MSFKKEIADELTNRIIPFWKNMRDDENGGFFGRMNFDLNIDKKAEKGCILNSRILWFFSMAYITTGQRDLLQYAQHAYEFMKKHFFDKENGGVYWSVAFDGKCLDSSKHTYCQAFAIYGLSAYFRASGDGNALKDAMILFETIEQKCTDEGGYGEAYDAQWNHQVNEKLSENGVVASRTMNTLLHIFEAYTALYEVEPNKETGEKMRKILEIFSEKVNNPKLQRLEVFFDKDYNSLIDLHSFGHDIEAAWLIDYGINVLGDADLKQKHAYITDALAESVYRSGIDEKSMFYENENGVINKNRTWWVQCEAIIGFFNAYQKNPQQEKFKNIAEKIWAYTKTYIIDKRAGGEWFAEVDDSGIPSSKQDICEPWKCPYHNGRMCFEIMRRVKDDTSILL